MELVEFTCNKIIQTNSNSFLGEDFFYPSVGHKGYIEDITWQQIDSINQGTVFNNFLTICETSQGMVTFSSDFVGKSIAQVQKLTTTKNKFVSSWSLSGVSTDGISTKDIPDPGVSVLALILILLMTTFIKSR